MRVVTRDEAIPVLRRIVIASVTRTVRDIPTERVGARRAARRAEVCRALGALADR